MLSIAATLLIGLNAFNAEACAVENQHYVKRHFVENKLIVDAEVTQEDSVSELKNAVVCEIKNELMLEAVDLCTYFVQQCIGSHIITNANATLLA